MAIRYMGVFSYKLGLKSRTEEVDEEREFWEKVKGEKESRSWTLWWIFFRLGIRIMQ